MKKYTHLTEAQRYYIYLMRKQGFSLRFIAKIMNRSVSTISREVKRNTGKKLGLEIGARFTLNCVSFLMRL